MNQTENIHIRPVNEKDAAFLNSLMNCPSVLQVLNEVPSELRDWMGAIKEWLNDDDEEDFIVVHRNISIGWLGVNGLLNEDRKAYLKMAVLLTDHQGLGFGTWAIQELMCYLRQRGVKKLALYTDRDNHMAQACYRKCGFRVIESLTETMSNGKTIPRFMMEACL